MFPAVDGFRSAREKVDPQSVDGSYRRLTDYLHHADVPVGHPDSRIVLVDTSFKEVVQELLAAAYPTTTFTGRYLFFGASPDDPHPNTKRGYELHLDAVNPYNGLTLSWLPDDPALTFACGDAVATIEETLHGPLSSPRGVDARGPDQTPLRDTPNPLDGLNPVLVSTAYQNPTMRQAVTEVALLAIADTAAKTADQRSIGADWKTPQRLGVDHFRTQVRAWVAKSPDCDPLLRDVLNSFVRRRDRSARKRVGRSPSPQRPRQPHHATGLAGLRRHPTTEFRRIKTFTRGHRADRESEGHHCGTRGYRGPERAPWPVPANAPHPASTRRPPVPQAFPDRDRKTVNVPEETDHCGHLKGHQPRLAETMRTRE